jgi:NitT/TauT family transport system permease protein
MAKAEIDLAISGLDALEFDLPSRPSRLAAIWGAVWPKLMAAALVIGGWQLVVWTGWKPDYILPGPGPVFAELGHELANATLLHAMQITLQRAIEGYVIALLIGAAVGIAVARNRIARRAFGSLITGLQTMPSIAWFPLAIVLFGLKESAIFSVVILGAAPAIANGLIGGIDQIPPVLLKAGRSLGARRVALWRHVILPAALPGFASGLKQGWAFAWRSLMAGELIVNIGNKHSLGLLLELDRTNTAYVEMMAVMVMILIIGIVMDAAVFGRLESSIRRRWGLGG